MGKNVRKRKTLGRSKKSGRKTVAQIKKNEEVLKNLKNS